MLRVEALDVSYDTIPIARDVDLSIREGETLALLGRSGSGKTTILKAIAGLIPIDRGTIELDGRSITAVPPHLRRIGLVFQDFALFPHLNVGDNVGYGLRIAGSPDVDGRVATSLGLVGLAGYQRRPIDQLSGGESQRVALARTLVTGPDLLLLDEPLGSLDPDLRTSLAGELDVLLHRTGIPTIVVTHDTAEAFALGDRVAVLVDGRIAATGPPDEVWTDPGSAAAARLMGHRSLIPASVRAGVAVAGDLRIPVSAPDGPTTLLVLPTTTSPGPIRAVVEAIRYRGPDWVVTASVGEGSVEVSTDGQVAIGSEIGIAIDPDRVITLAER